MTAYSLLYLGQEAVTCGSADDAMRLYLNVIHLYNNSHIDVIYQAVQILAKCREIMPNYGLAIICLVLYIDIITLDGERQNRLCKRVITNLKMNDHLIDQQIHICKLVVLSPALYFAHGDYVFGQMISASKYFSSRAYQRELLVDIGSLVTAFYYHKYKKLLETKPSLFEDNHGSSNSNTKRVSTSTSTGINIIIPAAVNRPSSSSSSSHSSTSLDENMLSIVSMNVLSTACRLLQLTASNNSDQVLFRRCCELIRMVFMLKPQKPIDLKQLEQPSFDKILRGLAERSRLTNEQARACIMQLIVIFRISTFSMTHFHGEFLRLNGLYLQEKVRLMLEYLDQNEIFSSLIELLPGINSELRIVEN